PASSTAIQQVETALQVRFPEDYREVVRQHQGEAPRQSLFDFLEHGQETTSVMGALFHFLDEASASGFYSYNLLQNYNNRRHLLPEGVIPFSEDSGGNSIAFDFRHSPDAPSVVFVNHEATEAEEQVLPIAPDFRAFLNL